MAITKRNYIPGDYETFTNESIGTPVLNTWTPFSLDGLFNFDVADDIVLSQDGSVVPSSAYELKTDSTYTAREKDYSGLTLVKMFRITNASYAGVATTASGKNFGSSVSNELLYSLYQGALEYSRTAYTSSASFTTSTSLFRSLHVFNDLTGDATFTITDGGGDERNKFTVKNNDSEYKVIVTDGDNTYNVMPGQSVNFYEKSGLVWANAGWEMINDFGGTVISGTLEVENGLYRLDMMGSTTTRIAMLTVDTSKAQAFGVWESSNNAYYTVASGLWATQNASYYLDKLYKWHNAA